MAINLWRRLRRVRVNRAGRRIKEADVESATKLRRVREERKLLEARLQDARGELAPIKEASVGILSTEYAQLWFLVPLLAAGLVLAVFSNLWALEPFTALEGWKRFVLSVSLPVPSLLGGISVGSSLRKTKGTPLRKVYFGLGFTILSFIILGVLSLNLVRGFDMIAQEQYHRASLNVTDDLDRNDKQAALPEPSEHKNLKTALITLTSTAMGVGGELASAFAFDQLVMLFVPLFSLARLRRRVRKFEDRLVEIAVEEEKAQCQPELERAIVAAEGIEILELQESTNNDEPIRKKPREEEDESLVPLAWKISGAVLALAIVIIFSITLAFGAGHPTAQTVVIIDLTNSVAANDEFNRNRVAVGGIIKRIEDAGHRIAVFGITESSFGQPALISSASPTEIGRYGEYLEAWKKNASASWQQISSKLSASAKCSNIFGAIARAAIEFEESSASKKQLIILSDMRQACRGYNFEKALDDPHLLIKRVERAGLIPRLDSVDVWVLGADTAAIDEEHWGRLKVFWTEYFKRSGAILKSFSPNRRLEETVGNP